ncbi:MAG: lipopolysaccharide kinase InaA family protein [Planctomycetota bacterium]
MVDEAQRARKLRRHYDVPGAIRLRVAGGEVLAWLDGFEVAVRGVAAHPDDLPESRLGGRRPLRRLASVSRPLLVREYHKGGLLRHVRGRSMYGPLRPLRELVLHRRLDALGVPVVRAVACVVLPRGLGWRGFLLVEEVVGARDLEAVLYGFPVPGGVARGDALVRARRAVRCLHDAGVPHPDLHPKNILLAPDGTVRLLDLDKARPADGLLDDRVRLANLVRMARSIEKHRMKGLRVDVRDALRFLEGYAGTRPAAALWLRRIRQRLAPGLLPRRVWWRLLGEARPWRPPRGGDHAS